MGQGKILGWHTKIKTHNDNFEKHLDKAHMVFNRAVLTYHSKRWGFKCNVRSLCDWTEFPKLVIGYSL